MCILLIRHQFQVWLRKVDSVRIVVIGRGHVGGGLARLWSSRGHQVTALGPEGGDATDAEQVRRTYCDVGTRHVSGKRILRIMPAHHQTRHT